MPKFLGVECRDGTIPSMTHTWALLGAGAEPQGCWNHGVPPQDSGREQRGGKAHHFHEQGADIKVGVLPKVSDDTGLHCLATTLHHKTRGGDAGHLIALHVPKAPSQDLGTEGGESS